VRAVVLEQPGEPTAVEDLELGEPRSGEVRIRLLASGICHSDLHVRDGEWERPGPIVLGHEGAGIVEAVGADVTDREIGQLVALSWYYPCLHCDACQAGRQWLCDATRALDHRLPDGTSRVHRADGQEVLAYLAIGTMAEATVVAATAAIPIPSVVAPEVAALIGCCVTTGVGAVLKTADVPAGASVAVFGLGGVGLSIVMGAVVAGASRIVAVDRMPAKLDLARDLGATDTVQATDPDATIRAVREATHGGPDFAFEAVGLTSTIQQSIAVLPRGGTAVLVGLTPFGSAASFEPFPFVDGSMRILGSNYGFAVAAVDFPRYAELHIAGRLPIERLIDRRVGLGDVEDAFAAMRRGEHARQVITSFDA
jgi:S-(hydroxymethyl)glutathione dehydrogenase / alcohol dehydrogenase